MVTYSVEAKAADTISAARVNDKYAKFAAPRDRVHSGWTLGSATGLDQVINEGIAFIGGKQIGKAGDGSTTLTLQNGTNHVYIKDNGVLEANITGVAPASSIKLWEIVAASGSITGSTDRRDFTVGTTEAFKADSVEVDGPDPFLAGGYAKLEKAVPYIRFKDTTDNTIRRIVAKDGTIKIMDDAMAVTYADLGVVPDNFNDLAGTVSDAQHGSRAGGTLHPDVTSSVSGFMSAADKTKLDDATSSPTASKLAMRDASGRLQVAAPSAAADAARKDTVDTHAALSGSSAHGATDAATPGTIMARDGAGRVKIVDPSAAADAVTKGWAEGTLGATAATANTIARRGTNGVLEVGTPTADTHATTKAYVDDGHLTTHSTTTLTLAETHRGGTVVFTNAGAITLTLPNSGIADGFMCLVYKAPGAGNVTLSGTFTVTGGGTTLTLSTVLSGALLIRRAGTWEILV